MVRVSARLRVITKLFLKPDADAATLKSAHMLNKYLEYTLNRRVDNVKILDGDGVVTFNVDGWPGDVDFMMRSLPTLPEVPFNSERIEITII